MRISDWISDVCSSDLTSQDPGDLVVFPAQAVIQHGQSQVFRVQYVGDAELDKSRHYYVTVAQLPVQLPQGERSEERREGKECVSTCRYREAPSHKKKKKTAKELNNERESTKQQEN